MKIKTTLAVGDPHSDPRYPNDRFDSLGQLIATRLPDNIVIMGDFGNIDSISFHNHGRPLLQEGLRLVDDLASMKDAYQRMMRPMKRLQAQRKKNKVKGYNPNLYWIEGNHEHRVRRYIETQPALAGLVPETDLIGVAADGWKVVPYHDYVFVEGVGFTHAPLNAASKMPLGGKYVNARAIEGATCSIVFGHHHHRSVFSLNRVDPESNRGKRIDGICAGMFCDYDPEYMRSNVPKSNWWAGVLMLTHLPKGEMDIESISMERVKKGAY